MGRGRSVVYAVLALAAFLAMAGSAFGGDSVTRPKPKWVGTVEVSGSDKVLEPVFKTWDTYKLTARAVFDGRRVAGQPTIFRGTLTYASEMAIRQGGDPDRELPCSWTGSGKYPVTIEIYKATDDGGWFGQAVRFGPEPEYGMGTVTQTCNWGPGVGVETKTVDLATYKPRISGLSFSIPLRATAFKKTFRPVVTWGGTPHRTRSATVTLAFKIKR